MGQLIWDIIYYWHSDQFGRLIRNIVFSVGLAAVLVVTGALFVGAYGWGAKAYFFAAVLTGISVYQIWLAYRRFLVGSEVGTIIEIARPGQPRAGQPQRGQGPIETPVHGIERYIQAAAALLASESTIGFIAAWLPVHLYRPAAAIMIPAGMTVAFWAIWQGGILWWPRINIAMAIGTLIGAALLILVQAVRDAGFDFATLSASQLQWMLLVWAVAVIAAFVLSGAFKEKAPWLRTLAWGMMFLGVVLTGVLLWSGALRDVIPEARAYPRAARPSLPGHWIYSLQADEGRFTEAISDEGTYHRFKSNKPFVIVAAKNAPNEKSWERPAGESTWMGGKPRGEIFIQALHPNTVVEIEEVR